MKILVVAILSLGLTACANAQFFPKDKKTQIDFEGRCERDCIVPFVKFPF